MREGLNVDEDSIVRNIPGFEDPQQRVIAATIEGVRVVSAYFPNGQAPGTDKFAYKLRWLAALHDWIASEMALHRNSRCSATTTSRRKIATCTIQKRGKARIWCRPKNARSSFG